MKFHSLVASSFCTRRILAAWSPRFLLSKGSKKLHCCLVQDTMNPTANIRLSLRNSSGFTSTRMDGNQDIKTEKPINCHQPGHLFLYRQLQNAQHTLFSMVWSRIHYSLRLLEATATTEESGRNWFTNSSERFANTEQLNAKHLQLWWLVIKSRCPRQNGLHSQERYTASKNKRGRRPMKLNFSLAEPTVLSH